MKCRDPLAPYPEKITERLQHWAREAPDRVYMAERDERGAWRKVTYAETLALAQRYGEALLTRNLSAERPLVILSGNSIDHQMLSLGAMYAGIAYAPVSPAYSLISADFGKLRDIFKLLTPGMVFVADGAPFEKAIEAVVPRDIEVVVARNPLKSRESTLLSDLAQTKPTAAIEQANTKITGDTIAKFLFTSGSTGVPKGVINTQRMLCSNQVMLRSSLQYFQDEPPVILDWAPWHHTAGGNHDVGLVLYNGGTFYIDEGKPAPGAIEATVRNLREVAPTWYFTVPKGYEALTPVPARRSRVARKLFQQTEGALVRRRRALAAGVRRDEGDRAGDLRRAHSVSYRARFDRNRAHGAGPDVGQRLLDQHGTAGARHRTEARARAGQARSAFARTEHYAGLLAPARTHREGLDEEGFYKLGDALKFEDPNDPRKGLLFDGRLTEDFKLSTGTWVSVGPLRTQIINRFQPYMRDVVLAGENENEVTALGIPDLPRSARCIRNSQRIFPTRRS